jgi:hypothetical protein
MWVNISIFTHRREPSSLSTPLGLWKGNEVVKVGELYIKSSSFPFVHPFFVHPFYQF